MHSINVSTETSCTITRCPLDKLRFISINRQFPITSQRAKRPKNWETTTKFRPINCTQSSIIAARHFCRAQPASLSVALLLAARQPDGRSHYLQRPHTCHPQWPRSRRATKHARALAPLPQARLRSRHWVVRCTPRRRAFSFSRPQSEYPRACVHIRDNRSRCRAQTGRAAAGRCTGREARPRGGGGK